MELAISIPDFVGHLEKHLLSEYAQAVEEWSAHVQHMARWEDAHLLDQPTPEQLLLHRTAVERLLRFGKLISLSTAHPDFPDRALSEMAAATQRVLQDKLLLWHGAGMSLVESDRILAACFPHESRP